MDPCPCLRHRDALEIASIPWFIQWRIPKLGPWNRAAAVHDDLYSQGRFNGKAISRKLADRVLLEAMMVTVPDPEIRALIFEGVRWGGWWAWFRYRHGKNAPTAAPPEIAA